MYKGGENTDRLGRDDDIIEMAAKVNGLFVLRKGKGNLGTNINVKRSKGVVFGIIC